MPLPITLTYTFATQTSAIPLANLDSNFSTITTAVNGIGSGTYPLATPIVSSYATFNGSTSGTTALQANAVAGSTTVTLPASNDTLVGKATTDTLTNKTINLSSNTLVATSAQLASAVSDETGSGALVFANTPTLVTPNIGAATGTSLATTSTITSSGGGIGYATGAGGTVTQATSRTTGVTLNKLCGKITLFTTTLAAVTSQSFVLTNSFIAANDMVVVQHNSGGTLGLYNIAVTPAAGSATITIRNNSAAASASEAPVLQFVVIKAVVA